MDVIEITTPTEILRIQCNTTLLAGDRKDHYKTHDNFFEQFTKIWLPLMLQGRHKDAEKVWDKALEIASVYEDEHKNSIHKGTAYYFWGGTCVSSGDLDMGFHLMHQALEEDKKLTEATDGAVDFRKTPAYAFVKMDDMVLSQFFRNEVKQVAAFVNNKLQCYQKSIKGKLDISILRTKVLEDDNLGDVPFFLVYNFFRLKKLLDAKKEIRQNDFASLLQSQTIFGFCIVAEELLRNLWIKQERKNGSSTWPVYLNVFVSKKHLPNLTQDAAAKTNTNFNTDFSVTLRALLDSTYVYENGNKPSHIEEDLLILYGFRNAAAHDLNSKKLVYENFEKISQRVLNALFFIIEKG